MPIRKLKLKKYTGVYELYRKSDGLVTGYYIAYRNAEDKVLKHKVDAATKDEALLILNQTKAQVKRDKARNHSGQKINRNTTMDELATEFFESKKENKNNHREKQKYNNHIAPYFKKKKSSELLPKDITLLQNRLKEKELSPKSINNITDLLRSLLRFAVINGYAPADSYKMDGYPRLAVDNIAERVFTPDEVRELIERIKKTRLKLFISMAYFTAQRPASLLALRKKDIKNGQIYFAAIKGQKSHNIVIHPELEPLLNEWILNLNDDEYIFWGAERGKSYPITYERLQMEASKLFEPYNKGLDYTVDRKQWASLYTLRHSAATNILSATGNIALAGQVLNHSDPRMTQRYSKIVDEQKKTAIGVL